MKNWAHWAYYYKTIKGVKYKLSGTWVFDSTAYDITKKSDGYYGTEKGGYGSSNRYINTKSATKNWITKFVKEAKL